MNTSLKVIESGTIRYIVYGFLLVFFSNFVPLSLQYTSSFLQAGCPSYHPTNSDRALTGNDTTLVILIKLHSQCCQLHHLISHYLPSQ